MTNPNGVSPKQSAFAAFVAEGDSYTDAYRKAYDASKMKDQVVWNAASRLAQSEKNPAATRVRALELLGKTSGLFDESTHITFENRTPEDVEKELIEKLALLFPAEA